MLHVMMLKVNTVKIIFYSSICSTAFTGVSDFLLIICFFGGLFMGVPVCDMVDH